MSDDADVYYNAWSFVMGEPHRKLLCVWHVDRAWKKNLCKIKNKTLHPKIYKIARSLMELGDQQKFEDLLKKFLELLQEDPETKDFHKYFLTEYASRHETWAWCHRIGLRVHHNMHLEAVHRVLKHVHLQVNNFFYSSLLQFIIKCLIRATIK